MITSPSNDLVKSIRKLRQKKYRIDSGLAFIEGTKLVLDAFEQGADIEKVIISQSYSISKKRTDTQSRLINLPVEQVLVSDEVFNTISSKEHPQGIGAVIKQSWLSFEDLTHRFKGLWVALWEVADPGNLGSIMRTIDAVGAQGVILIGNCTDPYDQGAIRGSMGSLFNNSLVKSDVNTFVDWLKASEITIIGTSDAAQTHYRDVCYPDDMILVMGSERQGLPEEITKLCHYLVKIPMAGISDSLNLAVATSVILYEIYEQNHREGSQ